MARLVPEPWRGRGAGLLCEHDTQRLSDRHAEESSKVEAACAAHDARNTPAGSSSRVCEPHARSRVVEHRTRSRSRSSLTTSHLNARSTMKWKISGEAGDYDRSKHLLAMRAIGTHTAVPNSRPGGLTRARLRAHPACVTAVGDANMVFLSSETAFRVPT